MEIVQAFMTNEIQSHLKLIVIGIEPQTNELEQSTDWQRTYYERQIDNEVSTKWIRWDYEHMTNKTLIVICNQMSNYSLSDLERINYFLRNVFDLTTT